MSQFLKYTCACTPTILVLIVCKALKYNPYPPTFFHGMASPKHTWKTVKG